MQSVWVLPGSNPGWSFDSDSTEALDWENHHTHRVEASEATRTLCRGTRSRIQKFI